MISTKCTGDGGYFMYFTDYWRSVLTFSDLLSKSVLCNNWRKSRANNVMLALETKQLNKIWLVFCLFVVVFFRRSHQSCSVKKGALKNFAKFTGKHLCQSIFLRLQASGLFFIKKEILAHVFSCELCEMFKNTSGRVLLFFCSCFEEYSPKSNCVNNNKTKQQLEKKCENKKTNTKQNRTKWTRYFQKTVRNTFNNLPEDVFSERVEKIRNKLLKKYNKLLQLF